MTPLDQFVARWAQEAPEQAAIVTRFETVTYAELDRLANCFGSALIAAGLRPGDRVGLHLEKSPRGVAAMLGTLRAGGVYVPIDPHSPPARATLIANDCGIRHMLISPTHLERWRSAGVSHQVSHFFLSEDGGLPEARPDGQVHSWSDLLAASVPLPPLAAALDDLAYILYTSGSTGVPKGVMISHRNALAFVEWAGDLISLSPDDKVASHAPFHFDLSVFDLYSTFRAGATVILIDEAVSVSAVGMVDRIQEAGITVWYSVPSALILMLERGRLAERGAPTLRAIYFAGEVFAVKYLRRLMLAVPHARFFNLFGPTETNVCLFYEVSAPPGEDSAPVPAGGPASGDDALILDDNGRPAGNGEIGELFIEGPTVMLGYWNGGRRSPARHPYPTGDRVSWENGVIRYHGRRDHMVKVRGYRIELGEVETAILRHASVLESVTFAVEQKLIVLIVPRVPSLTVLDIKRHCAATLPAYMIPHDIHLVPALPKTSTGKIDRVLAQKSVVEGTFNDAMAPSSHIKG